MSSALNLSAIKCEVIQIEKKAISWLSEPRTIFMLIWVSSLIATPVIYTWSPALWGLIHG